METKALLLDRIRQEISEEIKTIEKSAADAHAAAIHDESRPEDKYDTRALEASYLAGAQYERARILKAYLSQLDQISLAPLSTDATADVGMIVELERQGKKSYYFILPHVSGITVDLENGQKLYTVTPESEMGGELLDKGINDTVVVELGKEVREYRVVGLY